MYVNVFFNLCFEAAKKKEGKTEQDLLFLHFVNVNQILQHHHFRVAFTRDRILTFILFPQYYKCTPGPLVENFQTEENHLVVVFDKHIIQRIKKRKKNWIPF